MTSFSRIPLPFFIARVLGNSTKWWQIGGASPACVPCCVQSSLSTAKIIRPLASKSLYGSKSANSCFWSWWLSLSQLVYHLPQGVMLLFWYVWDSVVTDAMRSSSRGSILPRASPFKWWPAYLWEWVIEWEHSRDSGLIYIAQATMSSLPLCMYILWTAVIAILPSPLHCMLVPTIDIASCCGHVVGGYGHPTPLQRILVATCFNCAIVCLRKSLPSMTSVDSQ